MSFIDTMPKGGGMPIGTVLSYMGTTAPDGYLICDGSTYNIADYQALADHITANFGSVSFFGGNGTTTFAVPDLRGEFLRGTGTNSHANQGSGAGVGVHQNATQMPMYGIYNNFYIKNTVSIGNIDKTISTGNSNRVIIQGNQQDPGQESAADANMLFTGRPTNTSVLFIIKT